MASGTRDKIIQAGLDLFQQHGFAQVGLDQVVQQAKLTKTTFYNHFESKEALVRAAIDQREGEVRSRMLAGLDRFGGNDPSKRVLAIFDVLHESLDPKDARRCLLLAAMIEFPNPHDPTHQLAIELRNVRIDDYRKLISQLPIDPSQVELVTAQIVMLVDGVILGWQLDTTASMAQQARRMAANLIEATTKAVA